MNLRTLSPCRSNRRLLAAGIAAALFFAAPFAAPAFADANSCTIEGGGVPGDDRHLDELASDGTLYAEWRAPEFELPGTHGRMVSLDALRGTRVALFFLAADCAESLATLSTLETLSNRFAGADLEIVPVFIASGDVETLAERAADWNVSFPLVASEDVAISQAYDGFVVPSAFMIDADGRVRRRLVGPKSEAALDVAIAELLADAYPPAPAD